jgi:eukaryotic-like serine/threonine-protein kinase
VNRRHASLEVRADRAWLTDLGSRNGTFVDGVRIDGERELQDGDKITIGSQETQFFAA